MLNDNNWAEKYKRSLSVLFLIMIWPVIYYSFLIWSLKALHIDITHHHSLLTLKYQSTEENKMIPLAMYYIIQICWSILTSSYTNAFEIEYLEGKQI